MIQSNTITTNRCALRHSSCLPKCVSIVAQLFEAVVQIANLLKGNWKETEAHINEENSVLGEAAHRQGFVENH